MFLKYTDVKGRKYRLHPRQIGAYASEGSGTRIWASIAGMPVVFVVAKPCEEVDAEIEKSHLEEQEQAA